ncbi:hypothetical protein EPN96_06630 [bacterium]|nr:MAG: hypothetical protein EPN96_06630 [bacterium]
MAKGYCTELDPRVMPPGLFPEFTQLTLRGGVLRPRPSDEAYTPAPGSLEEWKLGKLGQSRVAEVYSSEAAKSFYVHTPKGGGTPRIYDHESAAEADLVLPTPGDAPALAEGHSSVGFTATGYGPEADVTGSVPAGERAVYAKTWVGTVAGARSGFSPVFNFENTGYMAIYIRMAPGLWLPPVAGDILTNSTKTDTAIVRDIALLNYSMTERFFCILIKDSEKTANQLWATNDIVTWPGGPFNQGSLKRDETPSAVTPTLANGTAFPAGVDGWALNRMEGSTGIWRETGLTSTETELSDSDYFPYEDVGLTKLFKAWPGPLDNNYLPETLAGPLLAAQTLAVHKGCLFVAQGSKIRYSEAEQPRYFREWAALDAGGEVLAIISRDEVAEVYTPTAVKYLTGSAPYFELRETGINEGPVSGDSIVQTDIGTFALFDDGLYLVRNSNRENVTSGVNTPFIEGLSDRGSAVGGASRGVYYLVDADGSCLAFDWEEEEWFRREFPARPEGFLYLDDPRSLVAKLPGSPDYFRKVASGTGSVLWSALWPEKGDGKLRPAPSAAVIDSEGEMTFTFLVDGEVESVMAAGGAEEMPLPLARGRYVSFMLSGEGSGVDTAIRKAELR